MGRRWSEVEVGETLPGLVLEMTATRVVAGALATRDFMPVHHDRDYANSQGAPDIFMNILSDNAYCSRFLTDWAGKEAIIRSLAIRLGVPSFANSELTWQGHVVAVWTEEDDPAEGWVEVALVATNDLGDHVTGVARLTLPR